MKRIRILRKVLFSLLPLTVLLLCRCGVKSDPLPPLNPPFIGVGHPTELRHFKSKNKKAISKSSKRRTKAANQDQSSGE